MQKKYFFTLRKILLRSLVIFFIIGICFYIYTTQLIGVNENVKDFYLKLKKSLKDKGYNDDIYVISGKRLKWHNNLQVWLSSAAKDSKHLKGEAIDIIVLDINKDGKKDEADVNIIFTLLDKEIIKDKGGIGTYKNEKGFLNRQMIHFDCRGYKARWNY